MYYLKEATTIEEFDSFFVLKSQKDAVKWSGFETAPERNNFFKYYVERILNNPSTHLMLLHDKADDEDIIVGYVQYDDITEGCVEIRGSVILKTYQGTGAYQEQGKLLGKHFKDRNIHKMITWASEKNKPSVYNLKVSGYTQLDEYDVRCLPLLGGEHKFYKWIKEI